MGDRALDPTTSLTSGAAIAVPRRPAGRLLGRESFQGYLFVLPSLLVLVVFLLAPALWVFGLSLYRWDLISSNVDFIAGANYQRMFRDQLFWQSLRQTFYYVFGTVPTGIAISLLLAVLLNAKMRARSFYRAVLFAPHFTPIVATLIIWQFIFNANYGVLNAGLKAANLPTVGWLIDPKAIMPAVIIYSLWGHIGYNTVIFLAGLSNIPAELDEAAHVDGAGAWRRFWNVTWPQLSPTTFFVLLISLIGSFKVFTQVFVLTAGTGGPNKAAETLGLYLYQQGFQFFRAGYASAISVALFVIILAFTAVQMRVASRRVFYR